MFITRRKPWPYQQSNFSHPLAKGLVGYWLFNEGAGNTVFDLSGKNNIGTLVGAPTWGLGRSGKALGFDGDDYVSIPDSSDWDIGSGDYSIESWFKTSSSGDIFVVGQSNAGGSASWYLRINGISANKISFVTSVSTVAKIVTSTTSVNDGAWYHVVGIIRSGTMYLYVNGISEGTPLAIGAVDNYNNAVSIGRLGEYDGLYFNGSIDEVRIYNRALSANEIAWLYREPYAMFDDQVVIIGEVPPLVVGGIITMYNPRQKPSPYQRPNFPHPLAQGLVGCWLMNEGAGNTVFDLSGDRNHGTLIDGPTWVSGRSGPAIKFDGVNDYIKVAGQTFNDNLGTVSAWINTIDLSSATTFIISSADEDTTEHFFAPIASIAGDSKIYVWSRINNLDYRMVGTTNLAANQWTHVAVTSDGTNTKIYINGVDDLATADPGATGGGDGYWWADVANRDNFVVGGLLRTSFGLPSNDSIDNVIIYNRALSANEIAWLYREPYAMFDDQVVIYGTAPVGRTTKNTDAMPLGQFSGMSFRM